MIAQQEPQFKDIEILREVVLKQNVNSGKIDITLKLEDYDLDDLLLERNSPILKKIIGKINIEVLKW